MSTGITHGWTSAATPDGSDVTPTNFNNHTLSGDVLKTSFGITVDGAQQVLTVGVKGSWQANYAGTITGWTLLAPSESGSCAFDVWKVAEGSYPSTVANTITGSAKPTLTTARAATSTTLTGWTTSFSAGDVFTFNLDSVSSLTKVTLALLVTKA